MSRIFSQSFIVIGVPFFQILVVVSIKMLANAFHGIQASEDIVAYFSHSLLGCADEIRRGTYFICMRPANLGLEFIGLHKILSIVLPRIYMLINVVERTNYLGFSQVPRCGFRVVICRLFY